MREELFEYTHQDKSQAVLGDIVEDLASVLYGSLLHEVLLVKDDNGVDNISRLVEFYTEDDLQTNSEDSIRSFAEAIKETKATENDDQLKNLKVYNQTVFMVDMHLVERMLVFTQSTQQVDQSSYNAFMSEAHYRLLRSPLHQQVLESKNVSRGVAKNLFVHASVWGWSKTLSLDNDGNYKDVIVNCSPFLFDLTTETNENGGSFQMSLAPVQAEYRDDNWQIKDGSLKGSPDNRISHSNLHTNNFNRSDYYFEKIFQENDVIFIRFETLEIEKQSRYDNARKLFIDKTEIPNKPYDMIALIDGVDITTDPESNEVSVKIRGRDLTKLLIEDGVYFYPQLFATGGMFANISDDDKLKRYDGQLQSLFVFSFKNVSTTLKFIMNALSNIEIVSDKLFEPYSNSKDFDGNIKDRRNYFYSEKELTEALAYEKRDTDVKKVISEIEDARALRGLINSTPLAILQNLNLFVAHLIKYDLFNVVDGGDFVGLPKGWGATTYDGQNLKANELPLFSKDTLMSKLPGLNRMILNLTKPTLITSQGTIHQDIDVLGIVTLVRENLVSVGVTSNFRQLPTENPAKGIWQIINLVIDESVQQRRLTDSSIGNEHGSLINAVKKICQSPFVEFFTDTYYDKFYFVARKQPFDRKSLESVLNGTVVIDTTKESYGNDYGPLIVDINEEDILQENITYGDTAFSWYYLRPINMLNGGVNDMNFAYLKAVYFKRYAEIWGSKPYDISTNYIDYYSVQDKELRNSVGRYIKQGIYDLKFIIDIHAHLPFTRKGNITITPNRRIKRANYVRLVSTGEIFYVDGVEQNMAVTNSEITRSTNLTISRGMVEKHINPPELSPNQDSGLYSYFDIINTDIPEGIFEQKSDDGQALSANEYNEKILANWGVNDDVFDFFLKKKQFL